MIFLLLSYFGLAQMPTPWLVGGELVNAGLIWSRHRLPTLQVLPSRIVSSTSGLSLWSQLTSVPFLSTRADGPKTIQYTIPQGFFLPSLEINTEGIAKYGIKRIDYVRGPEIAPFLTISSVGCEIEAFGGPLFDRNPLLKGGSSNRYRAFMAVRSIPHYQRA